MNTQFLVLIAIRTWAIGFLLFLFVLLLGRSLRVKGTDSIWVCFFVAAIWFIEIPFSYVREYFMKRQINKTLKNIEHLEYLLTQSVNNLITYKSTKCDIESHINMIANTIKAHSHLYVDCDKNKWNRLNEISVKSQSHTTQIDKIYTLLYFLRIMKLALNKKRESLDGAGDEDN